MGLGNYHRKHAHGLLFLGTKAIAALGGQSRRSVQRSLPELVAIGAVTLTRTTGGKTLDENGRPVACANGYELNPDLVKPRSPNQTAERTAEPHLDAADLPGPWSGPRGERYAAAPT